MGGSTNGKFLKSANGISMRAVAIADQEGPFPDRALVELSFSGTYEELSAVLLIQGAFTILQEHELRKKVGGGVLTPAVLGIEFVERLKRVGVEIESSLI